MSDAHATGAIRFLARLAPGERQARATVRAALPSRFAPRAQTPLVGEFAVERHAVEPHAAEPHAGALESDAHDENRTDNGTIASARVPQPATQTAEGHLLTRPVPSPLLSRLEAATRSPAAAANSAPIARATDFPNEPEPPRRSERREPALRTEPLATRAVAEARATTRAVLSSDAQLPLRAAAVAQRTPLTRSASPAVVQVTIDRLEVRLTPPAAAPARGPKARPASTLSLNDYLRRRDPTRTGGAP